MKALAILGTIVIFGAVFIAVKIYEFLDENL